jgi:superfamily II DNA or RNA helicase
VYYFSHRTILILVKRKDHALKLKKMLQQLNVDVDCFIHTDKTVNYDCKVLIATYSKGGVGFDHPKLNMLITGADVEENFMQYLGRIFRRDDTVPLYIDLRDELSTLVKHSQTRLAVCKEVGGVVKDFDKVFKTFEQYTKFLDDDSNLKTVA